MTPRTPEALLAEAARSLGAIRDRVMFVGGATTWIHITDLAAAAPRPTLDVDIVVEVANRAEYYRFCEELRSVGFFEDASAGVICRWRSAGLILDVLPTDEAILGFSNRWYRAAMARSNEVEIRGVGVVRVARPVDFLAMKLEAFHDRGRGDYIESKDLLDVVALVDGRAELVDEVAQADEEIRQYIRDEVRRLLVDEDFVNVLPGHLDPQTPERDRVVLERLRHIAGR